MLRNKQLTPYNNFRLPCPPLAKRGSLTHSQALALSKRARDVTALQVLSVRKPTRPSLPLRKAPPLTPALSPQERGRKPPSGARNRYAIRLAGHQSPRHILRDGTAGRGKFIVNSLHVYATCLRTHIIKHMIISVICTNIRKDNKFKWLS